MGKRLIALLLTLLFILPTSIISFAANPTSLEAPLSVVARIEDESEIRLRWTVPQSIAQYYGIEGDTGWGGALSYFVDWKINDGPWHFDTNPIDQNTYASDEQMYFYDFISGDMTEEERSQEIFFVNWHFGENHIFDFTKNTYTFRMRFAYYDYDSESYITSPFSNTTSVGGNIVGVVPTSLEAPTNLKVETKNYIGGGPYFYLSWTNPASVDTVNKSVPIEYKIDFKVGNGPWFSEITTHDWWSSENYAVNIDFDPVKKEIADSIVIEANTYYFRILYAYEPTYNDKNVYSTFSNIVSAGVSRYENAHDWARNELNKASYYGLIPNSLKSNVSAKITREEFAELAVLLYEKFTGKTAIYTPPAPFIDTDNEQVFKAQQLKIVNGTDLVKKLFTPNNLITREQIAYMLTQTVRVMNPTADMSAIGVSSFTDQKSIFANFLESVKFMNKNEFILTNNGAIVPLDNATREQAIMMAVRIYEKYKGIK